MKKIYLTLLSGLFISQLSTAQTLTQAANEAIIGDSWTNKGWDSVGTVPKTTGAGQLWDFSAFTQNTVVINSTYQATTSVAGASSFPGATIAENLGGGNYNLYKSAGSNWEMLGSITSAGNITYTNSSIMAQWPIAMGYSVTDQFAGSLAGVAALNGTITTEGTGTGTVNFPGGTTLSNVLQVRVKNNVSVPSIFTTIVSTEYYYYHASLKFPIVRVIYQLTSGAQNSNVKTIDINQAIVTGLNDKNFEATFQIFPNPAKDNFNVNLSNPSNENGVIEIYNAIGQVVNTINLGNDSQLKTNVSISGLNSGIYIVKTSLGAKTSSRRLIVE
ncbi:MAG: secreted fungalysin-like metallopeptidase [Bacteroidetes bacterium]|jgi:hypothetical protein|nr:secreted fungalysin-like metallopeptidase [Bacteroidota bacterium]